MTRFLFRRDGDGWGISGKKLVVFPYKALPGFFKEGRFAMRNIVSFLQEAKAELMRVNWPSRDQIIHYTMLVIGISLLVAAFLGGLDYGFSFFVERYLLSY